MAQILSDHFMTLEALIEAPEEDIAEVYGVGPVIAGEITAFFADRNSRRMVNDLIDAGITYPQEVQTRSSEFAGEVFVFTGTLSTMSRADAESEVKNRGGKAVKSVSKKTTVVVAGEKSGSKLDKAVRLGVKIIDEGEFVKMIGR